MSGHHAAERPPEGGEQHPGTDFPIEAGMFKRPARDRDLEEQRLAKRSGQATPELAALKQSLRQPRNRYGADRAAPVIGGGYRPQTFRSHRSFTRTARIVCHCMFETASDPPQASRTT
jgi:hypothetical protein